MTFKGAAVSVAIVLGMAIGAQAQTKEPASGEKHVVGMLGLADQYEKLFGDAGIFAVALSGSAGNPATLTRFYDAKNETVLGYFWSPQDVKSPDSRNRLSLKVVGNRIRRSRTRRRGVT